MKLNDGRITRYEYDKLRVGEEGFTEKHFNSLVKYNEKKNNIFFTAGHRKIIFNNYVGMMRVGNITIEILPKADRHSEKDNDKWHNALIKMLHLCKYIKLKSLSNASLRTHSASLFELYIDSFLTEFEMLIHQGLQKKYRVIRENSNIYKGKLIMTEQLKHNIMHKEKFYIEHAVYDYDNIYNRIMYKALLVLKQFRLSLSLKSRISKIEIGLPKISERSFNERHFLKLTIGRSTERYLNALKLARLIILHYSPDISTGKENVLAILFDMNILFEEFVYRSLKRYKPDLKPQAQKKMMFWQADSTSKNIRPDLLIEKDGKSIVVDTKWKVPKDNRPDDGDLKQMFVYNEYFESDRSVLLYPKAKDGVGVDGCFNLNKKECCMKSFELAFEGKTLDIKGTAERIEETI